MKKTSDYVFQKLLFKGRNTDIYRGIEKNSGKKFIFKILSADYPAESQIRRLKKEYELTKKIQSNYVVRTEGFEKEGNRYFIILDDTEGETLKTVFGKKNPDIITLLSVFSKIAQGLSDIHSSGIIHKDINPHNIIYNQENDIVKIIDFGISTEFIMESPNFRNPNRVEGTISYIAPEQTGRVNRNIDFRIDFYSLGVTFYELLTGSLPFISDEPMEMFYSHIAKSPVPPEKMNSKIPSAVAEIVLKLLKKNPDDRYNTALGLKKDLDFCLRELKQSGTIQAFTVGKKDYSSTFKIRGRLYGRENELKILEEAYRNACSGRPELVLISGYSGAGKTSIVNEMHRVITEKRGFFASGKFDQFQKNIPYYAFTKAFNSFCEYILTESSESIQNWKRKILNAAGNRGQVLIDFIPELEMIIGRQPEVPALNPAETQNRFNQVFYEFWSELDSPDHPLTLFIDDLQWSDLASLALLGKICTDIQNGNFLIIGAYRDNEVDENHPLTRFIQEKKISGIPVKEIKVNSLREEHVSEMISESVSADAQKLLKLNRFVYDKAGGNPFFTIELLKKLFSDGIFYYNYETDQWVLNENELSRIQISENIVSLMFGKIQKLDETSKDALASASCLGNMFDLETFSAAVRMEMSDCSKRLVPAAAEGLIFPLDIGSENSENILFKFSHDRIQQAAYSVIPEINRPSVHLEIGRNLLLKYADREDRLFLITDHLNLGSSLIQNETEIIKLVELNIQSAKKSKEAAAYDSALQYLLYNKHLLKKNGLTNIIWDKYYNTAYKYFILMGETEYLSGKLEDAETSISSAVEKAANILDRANAYQILIVQKTLLANYEEAIKIGRKALSAFEIHLPESDYENFRDSLLSEIDELTSGKSVSSLFDLPDMTDPEKRMAVNLLITMGPPCYRSHPRLWSVIVSTAVKLSIQYGNFPEAGYSHTAFGGMIGFVRGEYSRGKEFGELAERLMKEKFHSPAHKSVFFLMIGSSLRHWSFPLTQSSKDYQSAYDAGVESGNLQYAAYAFGHNMYCLFFQGMKLPELKTEIEKYLKFSRVRKNWWAIDLLEGGLIIINYLMNGGDFNLEGLSEKDFLERCENHRNIQVICIYNIMKTFALFILEKYSEAETSFLEAEKRILSVAVQGLLPYSEHRFIQCLLILHKYRSASEEEKKEYSIILDQNAEQLKIWSENCPENYIFKYYLVMAEMSRLKNDTLSALNYYDKAVEYSEKSSSSMFQAVALEVSAKFWNRQGRLRLSKPYMMESLYTYRIWGADFKTSELRRKYEKSDRGSEKEYSTYKFSDVFPEFESAEIDTVSLLKISHTLSGERNISDLLKRIMMILVENTGATRGLLILKKGDHYFAEAEGGSEENSITLLQSAPIQGKLPAGVLNFVQSTKIPVILYNAVEHSIYGKDPYIQMNEIKSVICHAILKNNDIFGIIYLENDILENVFTKDRLQMIEMISGHIMISIENAMYIAEIEKSRKEAVNASRIKTDFIANVSHEIRTPMNGILGMKSLLESTPLNSEQRDYLNSIAVSAESLITIINDILDLSKIESGKFELEYIPFSLPGAVTDIVNLFRPKAAEKKIELHYELSSDIPEIIISDITRLRQIILNLIGNSLKFTPDGFISLSVRKLSEYGHTALLSFSVQDTGVGIPKDKLLSLFNPFSQADSSISRKFGGTGLGLAISKKLCLRMGGDISVETKEGKGSTFTFTVQVRLPEENEKKIYNTSTDKFLPVKNSLKILLVEDNLINQKIAVKLLEKMGFNVSAKAVNGLEAIRYFQKEDFDLIIMDVQMPEMDGIQATYNIRNNFPEKNQPIIIAMTANAMAGDREKYIDSGMDDYISKPISQKELYEKMRYWNSLLEDRKK